MKIEELANKYYNKLTDNDHEILEYIIKEQNKCQKLTCEQLALKCHISRATLLRFCKKLDLNSFAELKYILKSSNSLADISSNIDIDDVCEIYHKMIEEIKKHKYKEICSLIYNSENIYIYGTGNAQKAEAEEFKRIFLSGGKCIIDLFDFGEIELAQTVFTKKDLFIIISLSGETVEGIKILNLIENTNINILSITRWDNNTIARMCKNNLYVGTKTLKGYKNLSYEMTAAFYVLLDILFVNYLEFVRSLES